MAVKGFVKDVADGSRVASAKKRLVEYGVEEVNITVSGDFDRADIVLHEGDRLVVCSLLDLCVSVQGLLRTLSRLFGRNVCVISLDECWLSTVSDPAGLSRLLGGLAEFGQQIVSVRTRQALSKVRSQGKILGRPRGSGNDVGKKLESAARLYADSRMKVVEICENVGITPRTFYRYMKAKGGMPRRYAAKQRQDREEEVPETPQ